MHNNARQPDVADVRSKLFVPGSRPELFAKALAGNADALSFDLEDSVAPARKDEARRSVSAFLRAEETRHGKLIIVRVNPLDSEYFVQDIKSVVGKGLHVVNLPKVESAENVIMAADAIQQAEMQTGLALRTGILANIETPKGLRLAFEIATAHPLVVGLQIGFVDFSRSCGIENPNVTALNAIRLSVRFAASEAGIAAFDGAYTAVKDEVGFRAEATQARSLGMNGKSCIHPSQIAMANAIFAPGEEAVASALKIVSAASEAAEAGVGAFVVDGKMVDSPVIANAQAVLKRARKYGLLAEKRESR